MRTFAVAWAKHNPQPSQPAVRVDHVTSAWSQPQTSKYRRQNLTDLIQRLVNSYRDEYDRKEKMDLGMHEKVALITGGVSGIGRATAQLFAQEGAKVVVAGIDDAQGKETVELIQQSGGECTFVHADVRSSDEVEQMVATTVATYGQLDYAVNSAGVEVMKPFLEMTNDDWDFVNETNLKGVWKSMQHEIAAMLPTGGGAVVNISSIAGLIGFPHLAPYVASKGGVIGLTRSAALEFAEQGVRVNCVCPGTIDTPMYRGGLVEDREATELATSLNPMKRVGTAEELAFAVVMLCSEKAGYMTGITVAVDGGWSQH